MSTRLWKQAERLANRPYSIQLEDDEMTDGSPVFIARNPELPGCKSHGETIEEALNTLAEVRVDYVHALLEDGLDVPDPISRQSSASASASASTMFYSEQHNTTQVIISYDYDYDTANHGTQPFEFKFEGDLVQPLVD